MKQKEFWSQEPYDASTAQLDCKSTLRSRASSVGVGQTGCFDFEAFSRVFSWRVAMKTFGTVSMSKAERSGTVLATFGQLSHGL